MNHILKVLRRCWIIFFILTGQLSAISYQLSAISYQPSAISYQLGATIPQLPATHNQLPATNNQLYKIGVLQPAGPAFDQYVDSWPDAAQRVSQLVVPEVELVTQALSDDPDQIEPAIQALVAQDVVAILAPALQVQLWISPAVDEAIQRFSLIEMPSTSDKIEMLEWKLIDRLSQEPIVQDVLRKLKFEGDLQDVLLLPVENELFAPTGRAIFANHLDRERISYESQPLAEATEVSNIQLRELKFARPDAALIISASADKAARIIEQARNQIGLAGPILVMTGDYQPILFALTQEGSQNLTTGWARPIPMEPSHVTKLASDLQLAPEAVPVLGALWAAVVGVEAVGSQNQLDLAAMLRANQLGEGDFFASGFGPSLLFQLYVMPMFLESWLSVDWWALVSE